MSEPVALVPVRVVDDGPAGNSTALPLPLSGLKILSCEKKKTLL